MSNIQIDTKEIWDCAKVINQIETPMNSADKISDAVIGIIVKHFPNLNLKYYKRDKTNAGGKYAEEPDRYALFFEVFTHEEKELILKDNCLYGLNYEIKSYDINNSYEFSIEHMIRTRTNEEANVEEIIHFGWLNSHELKDGEIDYEDTYFSQTSGSVASVVGFLTQLIIGISLWEEEQNEKGSNDEV